MDIDNTFNGLPKIESPVSSLDFSWLRNELHSLYQLRNDVAFMRSFIDSLTQMNEMMRQIHLSREQMLGNISSSLLDLSRQLKELNPVLCSCSLAQAAESALTAIEKDEDEAILSQHVETLESYMGEIPLVEDKPVPADKLALQQTILAYIATFFTLLSWLDGKLPDPSDKEMIQSVRQNTAVLMEIRDYLKDHPESSDQSAYVLDDLCERGKKITVSFEDFHDAADISDQSPIPDVEHHDLESVENADHTEQ